jgi:hypothetical protein
MSSTVWTSIADAERVRGKLGFFISKTVFLLAFLMILGARYQGIKPAIPPKVQTRFEMDAGWLVTGTCVLFGRRFDRPKLLRVRLLHQAFVVALDDVRVVAGPPHHVKRWGRTSAMST